MRIAAAALVGAVVVACGGGPGAAGTTAEDANGTVQLVMAPDPVWKWLEDQGIKQEMEEEAGIQILTSSSWDEFGGRRVAKRKGLGACGRTWRW